MGVVDKKINGDNSDVLNDDDVSLDIPTPEKEIEG